MTTVRNRLLNEASVPLANIRVEVYLLAPGPSDVAFNAASAQIVSKTTVLTGADGYWSLNLVPNSQITPGNTAYQAVHYVVGGPNVSSIFLAPSTGGPYDLVDVLTEAPSSIAPRNRQWYDTAAMDEGGNVAVTFTTDFGIDATTGQPYYAPGHVVPGEEAVLLEDLTLFQPGR